MLFSVFYCIVLAALTLLLKVRSCFDGLLFEIESAGSFNPPVDGQIHLVVFSTPSSVGSVISFLLRVKIAVFCRLLPDIFGSCNLHRVFW